MDEQSLPLGLGMALAQNSTAMERFARLPENEQQAVIDGARQVRSKQEMQVYVNKISNSYQ